MKAGRRMAHGLRLQCTSEAGKGHTGPALLFAHHLSTERRMVQEQEATTVPSPIQVAAGGSSNPAINPLRQMAAPWPHPTPPKKYINLNKAGKEKKKKIKKNQDHFRAVQIGSSAGCRSNQLMQLSWRPPVDHLPSSRVAVVAVSAGLAPRRAGPPRPGGSHLPSPGLFVPPAAGTGPGASPLPDGLWSTATCG